MCNVILLTSDGTFSETDTDTEQLESIERSLAEVTKIQRQLGISVDEDEEERDLDVSEDRTIQYSISYVLYVCIRIVLVVRADAYCWRDSSYLHTSTSGTPPRYALPFSSDRKEPKNDNDPTRPRTGPPGHSLARKLVVIVCRPPC